MNLGFIRDWIYAIEVPKPLQEFLLEAGRIIFIAAISALIVFLTVQVTAMPVQYQGIMMAALIALGKSLDKYKYVTNTENKVKGPENFGLVGF